MAEAALQGSTRRDPRKPHSEEAERALLGAALVDGARVIDLCVTAGLSTDSFYDPANGLLYEALFQMWQDNRPVDSVTVSQFLEDQGRLDSVRGRAYLDELVAETPYSTHAAYYIRLVHEKHVLRRIIERATEAIDLCYTSDEDAEQVLSRVEQEILDISSRERADIEQWPDLVKSAMEEIEMIFQSKQGVTGIPSGFVDLDEKLMGFKPGEMIILAARPSMGKTSLALNIAENLATPTKADPDVHPVAVFSLEMSNDQLVKRMLCSRAGVPSHKLTGGYINQVSHANLTQAASALMNAPIYLDDTGALEALELRSRARRLKRSHNIEMVVIDYLQMLNFSKYAREGRQRETAGISGAMKAMAKELGVPVLVLSQLSRAPETRDKFAVPKLSDLRDSGSIEQDADVVCLLRRPCKYPGDENEHDKKLAILDVAKNRNGPTGWVRLNFEDQFTRFENRTEGVDGYGDQPSESEYE